MPNAELPPPPISTVAGASVVADIVPPPEPLSV
jgi:hypothetical protein